MAENWNTRLLREAREAASVILTRAKEDPESLTVMSRDLALAVLKTIPQFQPVSTKPALATPVSTAGVTGTSPTAGKPETVDDLWDQLTKAMGETAATDPVHPVVPIRAGRKGNRSRVRGPEGPPEDEQK